MKSWVSQLRRRLYYAFWAIFRHIFSRSRCPSCGPSKGNVIGTSKLLFLAKRCERCSLVYRVPQKLVPEFYEKSYHKYANWYRDLQSGDFHKYYAAKFKNCKWDYYEKLSLLKAIKGQGRLLDFGGGSGILTWQLRELGFMAEIFEIGDGLRQISQGILGLKTYTTNSEINALPNKSYDVIFLHHVLEHLGELPSIFAVFERLLKDDGILFLFVPNGGAEQWGGDPAKVLDSAHVSSFDAQYFQKNLRRFGFDGVTFSAPYAFVEKGRNAHLTRDSLGLELALCAWKSSSAAPEAFAQWPYRLPNLEGSLRAQAGC